MTADLSLENPKSENAAKDNSKVLIIDDDRFVLVALKEILSREGFDVATAHDGKSALEIIQQNKIAVIICDQGLPDIKGTELLRTVQAIQPDAIRIILTANQDLPSAIDAINVGKVNQYVIKPWENALLIQIVRTAREQYTLVQENRSLHELILKQHQALSKAHENLRHDLALGARIHEILLMGRLPKDLASFDVDALTVPSKEIDGDFFEFFRPSHSTFDVVVGDVMGKGIPAALVGTAMKTHLVRFATPYVHSQSYDKENFWSDDLLNPSEIMQKVDEQLTPQLLYLEFFVSIFYLRFNLFRRTFCYIDCGSTKPLHYRAKEKRACQLSGNNFPLGASTYQNYQSIQSSFDINDIFLFYSDGVTESKSAEGEFFGVKRLQDIVEKNSQASCSELIQMIKRAVIDFAGKQLFDDDLTLIALKVNAFDEVSSPSTMSAKFNAHLSQLALIREFVNKICKNCPGEDQSITDQLQLAINEIFCNIVKHGNFTKVGGVVQIQGNQLNDGIFIQISDQGDSFDPSKIAEPSLAGDLESGFGWHIIKSIADKISYLPKSNETGWNHLSLFKHYYHRGQKMQLAHLINGSTLVITLEGETLDAKEAKEFKTDATNLISQDEFDKVVLDLTRIKYIDSTGLGSLLSLLKFLHSRGGDLKLACMAQSVRTIFELVAMHKIFEIYDNVEDAVRSFEEP